MYIYCFLNKYYRLHSNQSRCFFIGKYPKLHTNRQLDAKLYYNHLNACLCVCDYFLRSWFASYTSSSYTSFSNRLGSSITQDRCLLRFDIVDNSLIVLNSNYCNHFRPPKWRCLNSNVRLYSQFDWSLPFYNNWFKSNYDHYDFTWPTGYVSGHRFYRRSFKRLRRFSYVLWRQTILFIVRTYSFLYPFTRDQF